MQSFVSAQLQEHTCAVCYELMLAPERPPVLLFPCGHSFCRPCITQHEKLNKRSCPACRARIESQCINFSLQHVILQLAELRANHKEEEKRESKRKEEEELRNASRYGQLFRMYSIRARVLESSRDELVQQVRELGESNEAARLVVERLREEEEHARRRFEQAQRELQLVERTRKQKEAALQQAVAQRAEAADKLRLVEQSLASVAAERDKAHAIMQTLQHSQQPPPRAPASPAAEE